MELAQLKNILEAILLTADHPMDLRKLEGLFEADEEQRPSRDLILQALQALQEDYQGRGVELKEVASGYRMQVVNACADWVSRMWEEKAPRYSRALLETLVLIAYRQPITRGEIEEIRGVSVSSHIVKTLTEREWVRVLGHKDVPGRPSMYGTTREFLDYFNLKSLDDLPSLADLTDLDKLHPELAFDREVDAEAGQDASASASDADSEIISADTEQAEIAVEENALEESSEPESVSIAAGDTDESEQNADDIPVLEDAEAVSETDTAQPDIAADMHDAATEPDPHTLHKQKTSSLTD